MAGSSTTPAQTSRSRARRAMRPMTARAASPTAAPSHRGRLRRRRRRHHHRLHRSRVIVAGPRSTHAQTRANEVGWALPRMMALTASTTAAPSAPHNRRHCHHHRRRRPRPRRRVRRHLPLPRPPFRVTAAGPPSTRVPTRANAAGWALPRTMALIASTTAALTAPRHRHQRPRLRHRRHLRHSRSSPPARPATPGLSAAIASSWCPTAPSGPS